MSRFLAFIYPIVPSTCMVAFGVRNFTMLSNSHRSIRVAVPDAPMIPLAKNNEGSLNCEEK